MTVYDRFKLDDGRKVELGHNGTSIELVTTDEDGNLHCYMVRPETLVEMLEDSSVSRETISAAG